ncbi:TetR/AcrR family transcriptional regulator [Sinanaerobacter sp. ZZT-01]|uniref:TetR/AcrR family transcriptional regulator n=1 Tax=Sinanaerobacter sp. ZZT-01 TaxID=3111540 RepID=UPI002D78F078|nr:TetR/AcrR family transcriptional regulator [Sinanaerobacter sp. ZZT-01]WRR94929.1 TetR/AcrR family transcriptional regulator [Sinanaerobacter sp. ZZT-01]
MARNKYPEETIRLILDVAQQLFLEKGYEHTSIQEIINGLGGLSKGAVYHHFKSKEEIFNAVGDRFNKQIIRELTAIRDDSRLTGYEKLKRIFYQSLSSADRDIVFTVAPNMLKHSKLLAMQMHEIFSDVVPHYVQPVIEQGVSDGSILTEYPKELAEVITMLTNLWLNPLVIETDVDSMEKRVRFFNSILKNMGIELLDEQMIESYRRYCALVNQKPK